MELLRIKHHDFVMTIECTKFDAYSDERLKQTIDHERKVRGWGSERSYFLAALRGECEKRGIDYC
jgi:hypothetical protein